MHSLGCLQLSGVNISSSPVWLLKDSHPEFGTPYHQFLGAIPLKYCGCFKASSQARGQNQTVRFLVHLIILLPELDE